MRYFRGDGNDIYAYEDNVDEKYMKSGLTEITEEEALSLANPAPTSAELVTQAEEKKAALRVTADAEIAWRQDAVDADIASAEEAAALAEWKKYRVLLMRVDTSKAPDIVWPELPAK
ncbi:TPA: tail fiber assembly protein [Kluyvera cryocrescens]